VNKIKRLKYIWIVYILLLCFMIVPFLVLNHTKPKPVNHIKSYRVVNNAPEVKAKAFLLKDINSSEILYAKDINTTMSPASLTKVMTAIIAIESNRLNDVVTIPYEATRVEQFRFGAKEGDKFLLKDLLVASLVSSSNDAATAIGIHLAGSEGKFAYLMNEKAKELGMKNTHFTNPCGFDIGENVTTAYDLALLSEYAVRLPLFNEIVNYREVSITNIYKSNSYTLKTHNKLLEYYPYAVGIKTGYTAKAGPCLIARAKYKNKDALLIILNSDRGKRWEISKEYFDKILFRD
jgi:serine-type D-Ala-D-Ala carboxypeptidase (penicillin-binding protein 5/6)